MNGSNYDRPYGGDGYDDYDQSNSMTPKKLSTQPLPVPKMPASSRRAFAKTFKPPLNQQEADEEYRGIRADRTSDMIVNKGGT